ncbi:thioesterase II family protein [Ruminiclostridium papyrosolvens]|uniref:Thioesterase n=1 Tax=Ruminiclostridium papyrosolvens C7 TaxID=1330534 RepID=U4QXQ9_9FIRM|nr:thioesterase domain-containing protein [Ruminiclostridium papyrosolvens]EPR07697.1 thioesterase [Ruminiclostridium papyrosolvens C7]
MTKLFCIPYSGASAMVYSKWTKLINKEIKVIPLELAGRGRRFGDKFYRDIDQAAEDLSNTIINEAKDDDYAIFGHSMGARVTYEVYYRLKEKGFKEPVKIFFSGSKAPQLPPDEIKRYQLPDNQFKQVVLQYGGNSEDVFKNKELCDLFIPILRADFRIYEEYKFVPGREKIKTDVVVYYGRSDSSITYDNMTAWQEVAGSGIKLVAFDGSHFYLNEDVNGITASINKELAGRK